MLSESEIKNDMYNSSAYLKPMYYHCLMLIREYDQVRLHNELTHLQIWLKKYLKDKNSYAKVYGKKEAKDIHKEEIKKTRKQIKWLKYILNERSIRKRNISSEKAEATESTKERSSHHSGWYIDYSL